MKEGDDMSFDTIKITDVEYYIKKDDTAIVDVRNENDYARGHIESSINIPYNCLEGNKELLQAYKEILLYCDRGNVSLLAARDLYKDGFSVINLCGGLRAYRGKLVK